MSWRFRASATVTLTPPSPLKEVGEGNGVILNQGLKSLATDRAPYGRKCAVPNTIRKPIARLTGEGTLCNFFTNKRWRYNRAAYASGSD